MAPNFSQSLQLTTLALLLLAPMVSSRHVHHQAMAHNHPPRQFVSTPVNATPPFASEIASAAPLATAAATSTFHSNILSSSSLVSDIQDIAQGLEDFPSDLSTFFRSVEARLSKIEGLLEGLASCPSTSLSLATTLAEPSFWSGPPSPTSTTDTPSSPYFSSPIVAITTTYTTHIWSTLTATITGTSTSTDNSSWFFPTSSSSSPPPLNRTTTIAAGSGNETVSLRLITGVSPPGPVTYTVSLGLTQPLVTTLVTSASMSSASVGV